MCERLVGSPIELARVNVAFNLFIEARSLELLEPRAETRELVWRKFGDGIF
jgi:hypothetical protein